MKACVGLLGDINVIALPCLVYASSNFPSHTEILPSMYVVLSAPKISRRSSEGKPQTLTYSPQYWPPSPWIRPANTLPVSNHFLPLQTYHRRNSPLTYSSNADRGSSPICFHDRLANFPSLYPDIQLPSQLAREVYTEPWNSCMRLPALHFSVESSIGGW